MLLCCKLAAQAVHLHRENAPLDRLPHTRHNAEGIAVLYVGQPITPSLVWGMEGQ